jgi:hypothetical protein
MSSTRYRRCIAVAFFGATALAACSDDATEHPEVMEGLPPGVGVQIVGDICPVSERLARQLGVDEGDEIPSVEWIPGTERVRVEGPDGRVERGGSDVRPCDEDRRSRTLTPDMLFVPILEFGGLPPLGSVESDTRMDVVATMSVSSPEAEFALDWGTIFDGRLHVLVLEDAS